jgi:hypothetical protein
VSEDPLMTIEAYLGHVREHLPESMADEVIAELRGYMIEMAEDLGDGAVTSISAKKVVARFGAPSEVAREYALSASDLSEDIIAVHRGQQQLAEDMQQKPRELSPASYAATFFKFIVIAVLWLAISWTIITPFAYWWTSTASIIAPALQLGVLTTVFTVILLAAKIRGVNLRNAMFSNWSGFQKLVTFPENLELEAYSTNVLVDIGFTILTVFAFAPTILLLISHLAYAIRRFGDSDPVSFIRREYVVNIALLLFLNVVIAWGTYPWGYSAENPFLVLQSLGYSILILYQIVIRAQDLWWESDRVPSDSSTRIQPLSPDDRRKLLIQLKRTPLRIVGGIAATFTGIILAGFSILILANSGIPSGPWYTHWIFIVVMVSFFGVVSVTLASVYFAGRYYLVRSWGRSEVFGKRKRIEAAIDLIITITGLYLVIWSYPHYTGEMVSNALDLISGTSPQFRIVLAAAISIWPVFLLIAIFARVAADVGDLSKSGSDRALEAMDFSGNMFFVQAGIITGIYLSLLSVIDPYLPILNEMFVILSFSYAAMVLFAFQKSTSRTKLKWKKESSGIETL